MKPKTKFHHFIIEKAQNLKPITEAKLKWISKTQFWNYYTTHYNKIVCLECNHTWKHILILDKALHNRVITCPNCMKKLHRVNYWNKTSKAEAETSFFDRVGNVAVIRTVNSVKLLSKSDKPKFYHNEVMQKFYCPDHKKFAQISYIFNRGMYEYNGGWSFSQDMELRNINKPFEHLQYTLTKNHYYHPYERIPEFFKRAGFKKLKDIDLSILMYLLMFPKYETLMKLGLYNLIHRFRNGDIESYWPSIKICIRNHYLDVFKNPASISDYIDYLNMLIRFKKDLRNPKFVCPEDFHEAHQFYLRKIARIRKKEEAKMLYEEKIKRALKHQKRTKKYAKKMERYKDLKSMFQDYTVVPIMRLDQLERESQLLLHCAYENGYDEEENSLLLSGRYKGEVMETIEVNLQTFEIEQARGYNNEATEHNETFIMMVNSIMDVIKSTASNKKKKYLKVA